MKNGTILSFEGVYKIFKGTVDSVALDNISYDIPKGELIAIYGPSGSGKTTFLKCAGNIWKPTTGRIFYGEDADEVHNFNDSQSSYYRINDVGFIFQDLNLIPSLNVKENIELPMHLAKIKDKKKINDDVDDLLDKFGISRYKKSFPDELSGGEQQRVAIAVSLANKPDIILADEPTANLDAENRKIVLEHLKVLSKEETTIIIATHDSEVKSYADRVLLLDKGKMIEQ